eukprot:m.181109 g.181109  ORF g.181109 m.181109 type:complete len:364 (-) comp15513_c0_seq2:951-2042(-)
MASKDGNNTATAGADDNAKVTATTTSASNSEDSKNSVQFVAEDRKASNQLILEALAARAKGLGDKDAKKVEAKKKSLQDTSSSNTNAKRKKNEADEEGKSSEEKVKDPKAAADGKSQNAVNPLKKFKSDRFIEFKLKEVNPQIICKLCAGYYINATTITECLHTFCKSCIVKHFKMSNRCPTCGIVTHLTHPLETLRPDNTLQAIVFKIVPSLLQEEKRRQAAFYSEKGLVQPGNQKTAATPESQKKQRREDTSQDIQISFVLKKLEDDGSDDKADDNDQDKNKKVQKLEKPYIKTSSRATITHLKKFLAKKLDLEQPEDVDILCCGKIMGKEYSLEYISKFHWKNEDQLVLKYRPKVHFDRL